MRPRAVALACLVLLAAVAANPARGEMADAWSPLHSFRATGNLAAGGGVPEGWYLAPIHANLLPDGRILLIGKAFEKREPGDTPEVRVMVSLADSPLEPDADGEVWVDQESVPVECEAPGGGALFLAPAMAGHGADPAAEYASPGKFDAPAALGGLPAGTDPAGAGCGTDAAFFTDHVGCGGHTLTSEGRLFVVGGTRDVFRRSDGALFGSYGLPYAVVHSARHDLWRRVPAPMRGGGPEGRPLRWYPTATRLADGRILVTGGFEKIAAGGENRSVEVFDPARLSDPWTVLSSHGGSPPEVHNRDYTHVFVLPTPLERGGGRWEVLMLGADATPLGFALDPGPGGERWLLSDRRRPGSQPGELPNNGAASVLLPLRLADGEAGYANGSVLVAGGEHDSAHNHSADAYDPYGNRWRSRVDLGTGRHYPSTVLLPDSRVLVLAGYNYDGGDGDRERWAQTVDPLDGFAVEWGSAAMGETRAYHTSTLLLPDGSVLVAGGQPAWGGEEGKEQPTFRIYRPPYMELARPALATAPGEIAPGEAFEIEWQGSAPEEAVLVGLGSMTHSIDMDQRLVELAVESTDAEAGTATLRAPAEATVAPPGHYLLFVLDAGRVPSEGRIVRLLPG